jgi:hypothetical protein
VTFLQGQIGEQRLATLLRHSQNAAIPVYEAEATEEVQLHSIFQASGSGPAQLEHFISENRQN